MSFTFAKDTKSGDELLGYKWKVLIVDDDEDMHSITKIALNKFIFERRSIEFFDAYNGAEALNILKENPDIDLILLDVVMDSDDDGLVTAKAIREELHNKNVRIVLRTGQPGYAPERKVILNYDIDDYKEKTELTATKLFTTVVASLRTSKHLKDIDKNREGLTQIIEASKSIFKLSSLLQFTNGVLTQLTSILNITQSSLYQRTMTQSDSFFATIKDKNFEMLSTSGKFFCEEKQKIITPKSLEYLNKAYLKKESFFEEDIYVGFFQSEDKERMIFLYIEGCKNLNINDKKFLEVFSNNISIAFENICLADKSREKDTLLAQQSKMATMGEMIENIAHQWRQPLSLITTSASGMKMQKEYDNLTDEQLYEDCDVITKSATHLSQTIDDFRDFFKPDKEKSYFRIEEVVDKTILLLSSKLKNRDIKVIKDISDIQLYGLKNECIQSIINILNNAIDALNELNKDEKRFIFIDDIQNDDETLILTIKDNAKGIPKDIINNIFDQYFTTKGEKDGTGIGLYMTKYMIEKNMGGIIDVQNIDYVYENNNYTGACFTIRIKLNKK